MGLTGKILMSIFSKVAHACVRFDLVRRAAKTFSRLNEFFVLPVCLLVVELSKFFDTDLNKNREF